MDAVAAAVEEEPPVTNRRPVYGYGVSTATIHTILHEDLDLHKSGYSPWIKHQYTPSPQCRNDSPPTPSSASNTPPIIQNCLLPTPS